jgi:hypothetical protein
MVPWAQRPRGGAQRRHSGGSTPTRRADPRYRGPNDSTEGRTWSWGAQGGDSEQSLALLLFFSLEVFTDDTNSAATARRAEGRHSGGQHKREGPNDDTNSVATARRAERRHRGGQRQREGPNDGTTGPTTARKAEYGVGEPREGIRSRASLCSFFYMYSFLLGYQMVR